MKNKKALVDHDANRKHSSLTQPESQPSLVPEKRLKAFESRGALTPDFWVTERQLKGSGPSSSFSATAQLPQQ